MRIVPLVFAASGIGAALFSMKAHAGTPPPQALGTHVVLGYNDLGMHCMNQDFSEICILPPFNNLRATVIDRTHGSPEIVTRGVQVRYGIPGNAKSAKKTNFWRYAQKLFGVSLPEDVGLTGNGMRGNMVATSARDWMASGIPITPMTDAGVLDAYQLSDISVYQGEKRLVSTQAVVPVSWEISCNWCHNTPGISVATDILRKHDRMHGTSLEQQKPVLCAKCHADPALGTAGVPGVKTMSAAMHGSHATRVASLNTQDRCYSCHPGPQTQCFRDVHKSANMTCQNCHGEAAAVGDPTRRPWQDEPRCGSCHNVPGHEYEQPGVLFRDSVGHNGVKCIACHGSPHAITPTQNPRDNVQAIALQGTAGTISRCAICHSEVPDDPFNHTRHGD